MRAAFFWLIFTLIVGMAVFLRFFRLGEVPGGLYWDEVAMLVDAKAIAVTGRDMHGLSPLQAIFPSYGDYKLPVYIWLASGAVKLFGASEWALRVPSAVFGVLTVLGAGLIARELFPKLKKLDSQGLFLMTMLVMAVVPWSVLFSRTGFEGHVGQALVALSVWLTLKARQRPVLLVGAVLLGALATYAYFSIRFVWPVVFTALILLFFEKQRKHFFKWASLWLALPLLAYALLLIPMYRSPLFAASNQFRLSTTSVLNMADWPVVANEYRQLAGNTIFDKAIYHPKILMLREFAKNVSDNMSLEFLFFTGDPNLRHGTGQHGLFLWVFLPSFFFGWWSLWKKHRAQASLLLLWWLAALVPASVPETTPHALRSLNALVPLSLVIGWGSWQLWRALWQSSLAKIWKTTIVAGAALVVALAVYEFGSYYFAVYPTRSAFDWQDSYKEVAQEAWQQAQSADVVWADPFDSRFYLWLMAFHVPAEELHTLSYENFMPAEIGNIRFRWFDWTKLPTLSEQTVVIARKDEIDRHLPEAPREPIWYKTFITADGSTQYAAVYFEKVP